MTGEQSTPVPAEAEMAAGEFAQAVQAEAVGGIHAADTSVLPAGADQLAVLDSMESAGDATVIEVPDRLITPKQAAEIMGVNPKTITRWSRLGLIACTKTPGGHRRFSSRDIARMATPALETGADA